jgi:hypothetical protein
MPREAPHETNVHRMGVREWVAHQRELEAQRSTLEESDSPRQRAASPVVHANEGFARHNPTTTTPHAQQRTAGEHVSWLDRLNQPSTSRPFARDLPPHRTLLPTRRTVTGAPGGSPHGSSTTSSTTS